MDTRWKAFQILKDICLYKRYSNLALKEELDGFSDLDKSLITNIVYGTLQHYRYIRYNWENYASSLPFDDICVLIDMSVYQLLFLDKVPDYAVVNEAVGIAKTLYDGQLEKFVNAILHNVITYGRRVISGSEEERLAINTSMPLWTVKMWNKQYGKETCIKICESLNRIPDQVARVNTLKISKEELQFLNPGFIEGRISPDAMIYTNGNIAHTDEYKKGFVTIQDESSQLVSHFLDPQEGDYILDMCAAPGSKTSHLGSIIRNKGKIMALDIHEHRVKLIKHNARRLGIICIETLCQDASNLEGVFEKESFDKILLDGPCSGYGVIARKGDIKFHMKSEDMDSCIRMQRALLQSATAYLKKDGILVYSTCTLNKKENEIQIEMFLKVYPNFKLVEERTVFPFEYESDGFYMAKMQKIS